MEEYNQYFVALNSTASFVAIVLALGAWLRSARKALKIDRVVIHRKDKECTHILVIKNRKEYPVSIKSTNCYTKHTYNIKKSPNQKPEFSSLLNLKDNLFGDSNIFEIGPNGHTDIKIKGPHFTGSCKKLLYSMHTSHGYHEIWCKDITVLEMGSSQTVEIDYTLDYSNKYKALVVYYWKTLLSKFPWQS